MRRTLLILITLSILSGCGERHETYFKFAPGVTHEQARQIVFPVTRPDEREGGRVNFEDSASDWGGSIPVQMLGDGDNWRNPITREIGPMPDTWTAKSMYIIADWPTIAALDASPLVRQGDYPWWLKYLEPVLMWFHAIDEAFMCKRDPRCQLITRFVPDYEGEYMLDLAFSDKIRAENFGFKLFK